jgi:hypothetical protein
VTHARRQTERAHELLGLFVGSEELKAIVAVSKDEPDPDEHEQ